MEGKILENYNEVSEMISDYKKCGKKELKIKVWQCEYDKNGKMKFGSIYYKIGMGAGDVIGKELKNKGYKVDYVSTNRQVSEHGIKNLKTINMIVRW